MAEVMQTVRHIRSAIPADSGRLRVCMERAYAAYQERMNGARLPPLDVDYASEIENYPVWVVVSNGEILGGLIMDFGTDRVSIANIAVDPAYQGQGLGGELIRFAEARARERNYPTLYLATHEKLRENVSLYQRFGWRVSGKDGSRVFMQKKI